MAASADSHAWHDARGARPLLQLGTEQDDFYERALYADEVLLYRRARAQGGLHGEIALLRLRLYRLLYDRTMAGTLDDPELTAQVLRIVDLLVKALRTHGTGGQDPTATEHLMEEEWRRMRGKAEK